LEYDNDDEDEDEDEDEDDDDDDDDDGFLRFLTGRLLGGGINGLRP